MISNEERHKVARKLREDAANDKLREQVFVEEIIVGCIGETMYDEWGSVREVEILTKLADLIDPTCEVVGTTSEDALYGPTIFHHELSCGHTCDTGWSEPPKYCDECGARIMEVDDGE